MNKLFVILGMLLLVAPIVMAEDCPWWNPFGWFSDCGETVEAPLIGYEFYGEAQDVVHIWNTQDHYYFEKDAGIQLTNHYEDYWTRNVFCIGYYSGEEWVKIKCSDELTSFNKNIETDNETYVNATLWKDFSYNSYDIRLGVQYHLGLDDENLSITIYGKNIGIDIPFDLGFAWKITDWDIPLNENNDILIINNTGYLIKGTYDLTFKDMDNAMFKGRDTTYDFGGEFLRVNWDNNLNYAVKMYGDGIQENFYVALLIDAGHFNPGQEKSTTFQWIDAVVLGVSTGFVTVAPVGDPSGTTYWADGHATAILDTSPLGTTKITEIGWWSDTISDEANFEVGIYSDEGNQEPEIRLFENTVNAKGTGTGWKSATVDFEIEENTLYWIAFQFDDVANPAQSFTDYSNIGIRSASKQSQSSLPSNWFASTNKFSTVGYAIYAVVEQDFKPNSNITSNNTSPKINDVINISMNVSDDNELDFCWFYNNMSNTNSSLIALTGTSDHSLCYNTPTIIVGNTYVLFRGYVNDTAGNLNYSDIIITVGNTAPTQPIVTFPVDGNEYTNIPYINYTSTDADGDTITYQVYINGTLNITTTTNVTQWNASSGYYNLTVTANDGTDSSINSTAVLFWLNQFPTITLNPNNMYASTNDSVLSDDSYILNITTTDDLGLSTFSINITNSSDFVMFSFVNASVTQNPYNFTYNLSTLNFTRDTYKAVIILNDSNGEEILLHNEFIFATTYTTIKARNVLDGTIVDNLNFSIYDRTRGNWTNTSLNGATSFNHTFRAGNYTILIQDNNFTGANRAYRDFDGSFLITTLETETFIFDLPFIATFLLFDEDTEGVFNVSSADEIELIIFCPDETVTQTITSNETSVDITCPYDKFRFVLKYDGVTYYRTLIADFTEVFNTSIYLINLDTTTAIYNTFVLDDLLQQYDNPSIYIKKIIGGTNYIITSDFVDIESKIGAYLMQNSEYNIEIHSDNLPVFILGGYVADIAGDKVLTVYDLGLLPNASSFMNEISWSTGLYNRTMSPYTMYVPVRYSDTAHKTTKVILNIRQTTFNGTILYTQTFTGSSTWAINVLWDATGNLDDRLYSELIISHPDLGTKTVIKEVNKIIRKRDLPLMKNVSPNFMNIFILILLGVVAMSATIKSASTMSGVVVGLGMIFAILGWFTISWMVLTFSMMMSLVSFLMSENRRTDRSG